MATKKDPAITAAAKAMGSKGGKARAKNLPSVRRKEIASAAAKARWGEKVGKAADARLKRSKDV